MRSLTAYFAIQPIKIVLTGSKRMQKRPIKLLVEALNSLELTSLTKRNQAFRH